MMRYSGILICLSLTACATATPELREPASAHEKSYVSIDLPLKDFEKIKTDLEHSQKVSLKSRGEAHITLLTPPEMKRLRKYLSYKDIETVMAETKVETAPYKLVCVGKGSVKDQSTFYVVLEAEGYYKFRKALQEMLPKKGGKFDDFNPEAFYPHVTVGFTDRDLHLEDGVIKDAKSCIYNLHAN